MTARTLISLLAAGLLTVLFVPTTHAQVHRSTGIGGWAEFGLITAKGSFRELPGVETCASDSGRIDGGSGWSMAAGAVVELPDVAVIGGARVFASGRLGVSYSDIGLDSREKIGTVLDGRGQDAPLVVLHQRSLLVTALDLGLRADVRFATDARFGLVGGADALVPISARYDYIERIDSPAEAEYLEGGNARNPQSGSAPVAAFVVAVHGGVFGEWPLGRASWLRAELAGTRGLTSLLDGVDLTLGSLRLSVSVTFAADGDSTPIEAEE